MKLSVSAKNKLKGLACLTVLAVLTLGMAFYFGFLSGLILHIAMAVVGEAPALMMQPYLFYAYGIKPIKEDEITEVEGFNLREIVEELSEKLKIPANSIRRIGVIPTGELQAFTTGSSLFSFMGLSSHGVAISSGLLKSANAYAKEYIQSNPSNSEEEAKEMAKNMVAAIIAHELGHIAQNDVTMGVITHTIKMYFNLFSKILISRALSVARIPKYMGIAIGLFSEFLIKTYERTQETRADEAAFDLGYGKSLCFAFEMFKKESIISVKKPETEKVTEHDVRKDYDNIVFDFLRLFSTHPKLEDRIAHLEALEKESKTSDKRRVSFA